MEPVEGTIREVLYYRVHIVGIFKIEDGKLAIRLSDGFPTLVVGELSTLAIDDVIEVTFRKEPKP